MNRSVFLKLRHGPLTEDLVDYEYSHDDEYEEMPLPADFDQQEMLVDFAAQIMQHEARVRAGQAEDHIRAYLERLFEEGAVRTAEQFRALQAAAAAAPAARPGGRGFLDRLLLLYSVGKPAKLLCQDAVHTIVMYALGALLGAAAGRPDEYLRVRLVDYVLTVAIQLSNEVHFRDERYRGEEDVRLLARVVDYGLDCGAYVAAYDALLLLGNVGLYDGRPEYRAVFERAAARARARPDLGAALRQHYFRQTVSALVGFYRDRLDYASAEAFALAAAVVGANRACQSNQLGECLAYMARFDPPLAVALPGDGTVALAARDAGRPPASLRWRAAAPAALARLRYDRFLDLYLLRTRNGYVFAEAAAFLADRLLASCSRAQRALLQARILDRVLPAARALRRFARVARLVLYELLEPPQLWRVLHDALRARPAAHLVALLDAVGPRVAELPEAAAAALLDGLLDRAAADPALDVDGLSRCLLRVPCFLQRPPLVRRCVEVCERALEAAAAGDEALFDYQLLRSLAGGAD